MTKHTRESVLEATHAKAEPRYDYIHKPGKLKFEYCEWVSSWNYGREDEEEAFRIFTQSAMSQLLNRLGMSVRQYNRSPDWLKAHNFNYFSKQHDKKLKFRMNNESQCRAVLSESYGIIDDIILFPILFDILKDRSDLVINKFHFDDYITQLYLSLSDATGEHNGQTYTAGLLVTNSETAHSSVWIEPVVHLGQYAFLNRRSVRKQGVDCRIIHRGSIDPGRVKKMVERNSEVAQVGVVQLAELFQRHVPVSTVLSYVKNNNELPSRWEAMLEEIWSKEETVARAEAARQILVLAEGLPLFQRIQAEQAAGGFINLFDQFEDRMDAILAEI